MLFLLRFTFWILVICLLIPGQPRDNRRLLSSAERTVNDFRGFCERNPDVCEDARVMMTSVLTKLKSVAELIQTWLVQDGTKGTEASGIFSEQPALEDSQPAAKGPGEPLRAVPKWGDSLRPADKEMPWRGPAQL